jgi:nucleoside-diphosphate-sugar epimerase
VQSYTGNASEHPLAADLDYIVTHTGKLWEELRGKRLFITGGTGFFGSWLLESFAWANKKLDLNASALVLTRNLHLLKKNAPQLAENPAIQFHIGDVRNFTFPEGEFSYIIHAATTSAVATFNNLEDPLVKFDTIANGTRRTLDFAAQCNTEKFLLTSSGVVYGKQPPDMTHIPEEYQGAPYPPDPNSVVGESKRTAELLCALYSNKYGITTTIARCFVFVGPCLPLDIHYAIGNFIRDGLRGDLIRVNGDGTPYRSYLYAADLTIWLWTILFKGLSCRAYNVGSEESVTIADLANRVAKCFQKPLEVHVAKTPVSGSLPDRYVPSTKRAQCELGLKQRIDLETAIRRTIAYHLSIRSQTGSHAGIP